MLTIELITTGSELLLGFTLNTHTSYLGRQLGAVGLRLTRQTTVGDDPVALRQVISEAIGRCDVLLVSGGLGPTTDDCTRPVLAEVLGVELVPDAAVAAAIAERHRRRGRHLPESVKIQSLIPQGATVLPNENGTAPGLRLERGAQTIFVLPGPPRELRPMFEASVLPWLRERAGGAGDSGLACRVLRVAGLPELAVQDAVRPVAASFQELEVGYSAKLGEVELRVIARTLSEADSFVAQVRAALGPAVYGSGEQELESAVIELLAGRGETVAVAESCSGGLITHRLTNVSGSSAVLRAGCVTYSNESKIDLVGVEPGLIAAHGAVSEPVARAMADGVRRRQGTTYGLSTTGIAGPTGGTADKPVGLVYLGLATASGTDVQQHFFEYDRETFKRIVSQTALAWLRQTALATASAGS